MSLNTRQRSIIDTSINELEAEHYPDPDLMDGKYGCIVCWPQGGNWPCGAYEVAQDLRELQ